MTMVPSALASKIMSDTSKITDPSTALNTLWSAICEYIQSNAVVTYSWAATDVKANPDPVVIWAGTLATGGQLSLSGLSVPSAAMSEMSSQMNVQAATWRVVPASGFSLSPGLVIPSIALSLSGVASREAAINHLASEIIDGIKAATPALTGTHGAFTGVATFVSIL